MQGLLQDDRIDLMRLELSVYDHFEEYTSGDRYTSVLTDSGTIAVEDAAGGVVVLTPSDGTVADNDEAYLKGKTERFLFANDKPGWWGCRAKFTEANTDDANVILGVKDAVAADTLQDNGAGPAASYSGAVFFKVDGGTVWWFETSIAGTQQTTQINDVSNAGDGTWRVFEIEWKTRSSTQMEVVPKINGAQCRDTNGAPIKHLVTYTGATEMQECAGVKNGGANLETLRLDWMGARQKL